MNFFSELSERVSRVGAVFGEDLAAADIPAALAGCGDETVVALLREATAVVRAGEVLRIAASGVAAARSTRESGHGGLAQTRGHRSSVSLIQEITGSSKADATRQVRLGTALIDTALIDTAIADAAASDVSGAESPDPAGADPTVPEIARPWHAPLGDALLAGTITSAQHDVILRGLGEPPAPAAAATCADATPDQAAAAAEAWSTAAQQLITEAGERTVEELARTARTVRDVLDPEGAARRFDERFEHRSFRMWTDADGARRGSFAFDDLGGVWVQTILDSALRPRRGGPRFVDPAEKTRAEDLAADPRTNDQLAYDLLLDVLRAGALTDAKTVFGTRQPGVRVLLTADAATAAHTGQPAVGVVEDDQTTLPGWLIEQQCCDTGTIDCTLDRDGNPLDLGREQRLFTPRQRLALAIRDGGCRWRGCDRPASYCEAHHIDHYADGGCTDIDRGILLCRFHHMTLHHGGWRITRNGHDDFLLHPPDSGDPIVLTPRLTLRYAWADLDPPPKRFRPAA